jgi:hypothetical protein
MKYLLILVILNSGTLDEITYDSLAECQKAGREIAGDTREGTERVLFISPDGSVIARCQPKK